MARTLSPQLAPAVVLVIGLAGCGGGHSAGRGAEALRTSAKALAAWQPMQFCRRQIVGTASPLLG
jgi:hypothetical protein